MFAEYLSPLKSGGLAVGKVSFCKEKCHLLPRQGTSLAGSQKSVESVWAMEELAEAAAAADGAARLQE